MSVIFRRKPKAPEVTGKIEYMIACLGNPGSKYEKTRHNAGFLAADVLWNKYGSGKMNQMKCKAVYGLCVIEGKNVAIVKPQTFMNLSGEAIRDLSKALKIERENILVIYDDISLKPGKVRIRPSGSDGGHNGIKSIIYCLGTNVFPRIKIGVGAPDKEAGEDLADFVLDTIDAESIKTIQNVPDIVEAILTNGIDIARQKFN